MDTLDVTYPINAAALTQEVPSNYTNRVFCRFHLSPVSNVRLFPRKFITNSAIRLKVTNSFREWRLRFARFRFTWPPPPEQN